MKRTAVVVAPITALFVGIAAPAAAQPNPNDRALQNPGCQAVLMSNQNASPDGPNAGTPGNRNFFEVGLAFGCITGP